MYISVFNEFLFLAAVTFIVFQLPGLRSVFIPKPVIEVEPTPLKKSKNGRTLIFDVLRGVAILGVIIIHVTDLFPEETMKIHRLTLETLDASARFALPIFFVTSGLLLRNVQTGAKNYFTFIYERSIKLLPPYIIVTLVLALLGSLSFKEFGLNLLTGGGSVPFYFIVILFQLYLIYPFIADISKKRWFVFASFWFSLIFFYLHPLVYLLEVPTAFRFVFFFVWGIYMREQFLLGRLRRDWSTWALITALCVVAYAFFPGQYYNARPFYGLSIMMLLFMLFTNGYKFDVFENILAWVGSISLWIFLTHYPIMEYMLPFIWNGLGTNAYWALLVAIPISILVSVFFGYVCTKVYNSAALVFSGSLKKERHLN